MGKRKTHEDFLKELSVINPNIEIMDKYQTNNTKIKCRCKLDEYEWFAIPINLLRGEGCPECGRVKVSKMFTKSHEKFVEELEYINSNIEIIGNYKNNKTKIKCRCKIDGYEWEAIPIHLLRGIGCPVCSNRIIISGVNDIKTTHPSFVKYFKNIDDSTKYSSGSAKKITCICPDCGYEKNMPLYHLINYGFACHKCGDGVSYPNKFIRLMLDQLLGNDVFYEWNDDWCGAYRYDSYFIVNEKQYIVEADGGWHYQDNKLSNISVDKTREIDNLKDRMAREHDITVIRIDCRQSDKNYILNNIMLSPLSEIFDLSCIDWDRCNEFACKNLIKEVCNIYRNYEYNIDYLSSLFHLHKRTIQSYLVKGNEIGWCKYTLKKAKKPIDVFDLQNNKLYSFESVRQCVDRLSIIYNMNFAYNSVVNACEKLKSYKGFNFKWA